MLKTTDEDGCALLLSGATNEGDPSCFVAKFTRWSGLDDGFRQMPLATRCCL